MRFLFQGGVKRDAGQRETKSELSEEDIDGEIGNESEMVERAQKGEQVEHRHKFGQSKTETMVIRDNKFHVK